MSAPTSTNGHGSAEAARRTLGAPAGRGGARGGLRRRARLACSAPSRASWPSRIPPADLDERDPDYIRESLPRLWLLCSLYFRGEVRGLGNVPEEGGVLLVGNHSGGNLTPDTIVFTLAFSTYFGVERAFHQLAHNLVLSFPGLSYLRKYGTVAASHENARTALEAGAAVLVYPGGDYEVHRPSWHRHRVDFGGRKGFIRLALDQDVPIVPVVAVGGQETALFLSRGESLAQVLGLDRLFRLKVLPVSLALPWGLNVGDMLGHIPLPAKITVEALPPIHLREEFGPEPDVDEVYDHVVRLMQDTLDALAAERRLPVIGLMRVAESITVTAPPELRLGGRLGPRALPALHVRRHALVGRGRAGDRPRRPLPDAAARRLGRGRRADRGRRVQAGARPRLDSVTGIDQRGRWRIRERGGASRVELRLQYGVAGSGIWGWIAESLAARTVSGHLRRSLQQLKRQVEHEQLRVQAAARRCRAGRAAGLAG